MTTGRAAASSAGRFTLHTCASTSPAAATAEHEGAVLAQHGIGTCDALRGKCSSAQCQVHRPPLRGRIRWCRGARRCWVSAPDRPAFSGATCSTAPARESPACASAAAACGPFKPKRRPATASRQPCDTVCVHAASTNGVLHDARRHDAAVARTDRKFCADRRELRGRHREADRPAECRRVRDARHATGDLALMDHQVRLEHRRVIRGQLESHQHLPWAALLEDAQPALAHEERLAHAHRPPRLRFEGIGQTVGVLADDDVALLEPQHALRLDTERADPVRSPALISASHTRAPLPNGTWISYPSSPTNPTRISRAGTPATMPFARPDTEMPPPTGRHR